MDDEGFFWEKKRVAEIGRTDGIEWGVENKKYNALLWGIIW